MKTVIKYKLTPEQYKLIFGEEDNDKYYAKLLGLEEPQFIQRKNGHTLFKSEELRKVCKVRNIDYPFIKPVSVKDYYDENDAMEIEMMLEDMRITKKELSQRTGIPYYTLVTLFKCRAGVPSSVTDKLFNYLYSDE